MRRAIILGLLLAGVTLGLYWPVAHFGLVYYDDPLFLLDAPEIQNGTSLASIARAFSGVILANWHPVTTLSFEVDHQLFGTNPPAEHLVNLLFHTANAVLLFLLWRALTQSEWRSALVAALFAWHPLRVESVAWITERKDVLSGFFFLLALLAYTRYVQTLGINRSRSRRFYGLSLLAMALGLMSKPMLVSLPLVLLLLDFWPLQRGSPPAPAGPLPLARLLREKLPFFALAAAFSGLAFIVQKQAGAVVSLSQLAWHYRLANAITNYWRYLGKLVWPVNLAVDYPYVRIDDWGQTGLLAVALAGVTWFCLRQAPRRPWLAVGWFWYLLTSVPIIGLVQIGEAAMADRYTYLTLIGPVVALVWSIPATRMLRQTDTARPALAGPGRLLVALIAVLLVTLLGLTSVQIQYWRDTVSLFAHAIAVTPPNPGAEGGLAVGLEHAGQPDEALAHYRRAESLNPQDPDNFLKSGRLLLQQKRWAEAADDTFQALALRPGLFSAHENLGLILPQLGQAKAGLDHWQTALTLQPDSPDLLNNLAWSLATNPDPALRDGPRAVELAEKACRLDGYHKTIDLGTLAAAYAEAGRFDQAIATAQQACTNAARLGESALLARNQELLARYQQHQPWHDPPPPSAASPNRSP